MKKMMFVAMLSILGVMASAAPAKAACYLTGYIWMENSNGYDYPPAGATYAWPYAWGQIENSTHGDPNVEITCGVTGIRLHSWMNSMWDCYEGRWGNYECENDGPNGGAEAIAEAYLGSGHYFYGTWWHKGDFAYWTNSNTTLSNIQFVMTAWFDFGWGEAYDPTCEAYGSDYWWDGYECAPIESPILVPTGKSQAVKLTSLAEGVPFDWNCDGRLEQTAWTERDSEVAFLAYDADGNGKIECGKELFGNYTVPGQPNGFAALNKLGGGKGMLDDNPFFSKLLLWTDRNHNGVSDPGELVPFGNQFAEVSTGATNDNRRDGNGNLFKWRGYVVEKIPNKHAKDFSQDDYRQHTRPVYDVFFKGQPN